MPTANLVDVRSVLDDFSPRIRSVIDASWSEFQDLIKIRRMMYPRTRANVFFDILVQNAILEFHGDDNINVLAKRTTVQFLFKDRVLVRFKKGNARGVGSNIETQAILDFVDPQLTIPGLLPDIHRVEICYQPDLLGTQLQEVAVVARDRTRRIWAYPLDKPAGSDVTLLPHRAPDETLPTVTPKKPKSESGEEE